MSPKYGHASCRSLAVYSFAFVVMIVRRTPSGCPAKLLAWTAIAGDDLPLSSSPSRMTVAVMSSRKRRAATEISPCRAGRWDVQSGAGMLKSAARAAGESHSAPPQTIARALTLLVCPTQGVPDKVRGQVGVFEDELPAPLRVWRMRCGAFRGRVGCDAIEQLLLGDGAFVPV
jgi:hypothetical protein